MKTIKTLLAVSVVVTAAQAHATCYNTSGSMTAISTVGATSTPTLYVHANSTGYNTTPTVFPTFAGSVCIDTSASPATVTGIYADEQQYTTSVKVLGGLVTAYINQPHAVYNFGGGTTYWTALSGGVAGEGTFKLGQTLTLSGGNSQTSDAYLGFDYTDGATDGSCTGSSLICNAQRDYFLANPDLERFYMTVTITWDAVLGKFRLTGTAVGADVGNSTTGNTWYSWSFTGVEQ